MRITHLALAVLALLCLSVSAVQAQVPVHIIPPAPTERDVILERYLRTRFQLLGMAVTDELGTPAFEVTYTVTEHGTTFDVAYAGAFSMTAGIFGNRFPPVVAALINYSDREKAARDIAEDIAEANDTMTRMLREILSGDSVPPPR